MAADTKYLPEPKAGRPPLRRTPRGMTYSQGRPHGVYSTARPAPAPRPVAGPAQPSRAAQASSAVRSGRQFAAPEFREYQGIILAEFVLAELLVAATPIATRQNQPGLSPYIPRDMTKLLALGMVYFLLELMAVGGGRMARLGAWFGGLILLAVGLNEGANVAKDLDIFGAQPKDKSAPPDEAV